MKEILNASQRSKLLKKLTRVQRESLFTAISLTHKSEFANILASYKGTEKWEFLQYVDHGEVSTDARCECGRALRYEFILKHKETHKIRSLGINHLQEELNIPDEIAKEVYKKIHTINYDLDEILTKVKQGWVLDYSISLYIQDSNTILPAEIKILLEAKLPILDRHIQRILKDKNSRSKKLTNPTPAFTPLLEELIELTPYISENIVPLLNSQKDSRYLITKDLMNFKVLKEINYYRKKFWENNFQLVYERNLFEVEWSYSSTAESIYRPSRFGPKMCIARIDSLPKGYTGLIVIHGNKSLEQLQEDVRRFLKKNNMPLDTDDNAYLQPPHYDAYDCLRQEYTTEIDFLRLHEYQIEIGKLGEAFVYDFERTKLSGSPLFEKIDNSKALEPTNGYDILSYEEDGTPIHIEVKTSVKTGEDFFISSNELNLAKSMRNEGKVYVIYRIENILAESKSDIIMTKIYDLDGNNKVKLEPHNWRVSIN